MVGPGWPPWHWCKRVRTARRAYCNFFDSLSGKRKGRKVGAPRFRSDKDHRQSIRLTRNGFTVTDRAAGPPVDARAQTGRC